MNSEITNCKALSYSVVFVWKNLLNSLPPLAPDFCKDIFGDRDITNYTLGRNGILVNQAVQLNPFDNSIPALSPPYLNLGFDRLVLTHLDKAAMLNAYQMFEHEIKKMSFNPMLITGQLGINIEYEVEFSEGNSQLYLNNRFQAPENTQYFLGSSITEIKLTILESTDGPKIINLGLQPRSGRENAFFVSVNDHFSHVKNQTFINVEELLDYINNSETKLSAQVVPYLNLLGNGK